MGLTEDLILMVIAPPSVALPTMPDDTEMDDTTGRFTRPPIIPPSAVKLLKEANISILKLKLAINNVLRETNELTEHAKNNTLPKHVPGPIRANITAQSDNQEAATSITKRFLQDRNNALIERYHKLYLEHHNQEAKLMRMLQTILPNEINHPDFKATVQNILNEHFTETHAAFTIRQLQHEEKAAAEAARKAAIKEKKDAMHDEAVDRAAINAIRPKPPKNRAPNPRKGTKKPKPGQFGKQQNAAGPKRKQQGQQPAKNNPGKDKAAAPGPRQPKKARATQPPVHIYRGGRQGKRQ